MLYRELQDLFKRLPEVQQWPELESIFSRAGDIPRPDWELPVRANRSLGGNAQDALYVAASVACLQLSIMLADDILDDDPRGAHISLGVGPVSNMALAYQSASLRLLQLSPQDNDIKNQLSDVIARTALETAVGQNLDTQNLSTEADYWRVVEAKSTPFYGACLEMGAISAGANRKITYLFRRLGKCIGEIIQLEDDLEDALAVPANADWLRGRNNLLILYAKTAEYPEKQLFSELATDIEDVNKLTEAQNILVSSGAVSYCIFHVINRYRQAREIITDLTLPQPSHIEEIFNSYAETLLKLLKVSGIEITKTDLLSNSPLSTNKTK